jgi:hypothetical protein
MCTLPNSSRFPMTPKTNLSPLHMGNINVIEPVQFALLCHGKSFTYLQLS